MKAVVVLTVLASLIGAPAPAQASRAALALEVLSSRPDQVSGGDALIRVRQTRGSRLKVLRNGEDVTAVFRQTENGLTGLVTGLTRGDNTITAVAWPYRESLRLRDHPIQGPIFSGAHQYPFLCKTQRAGLGPPAVDNQDGQGMRVSGGWSRDCFAPVVTDRLYRSTDGTFKPMPAERPADLATTTLLDGREVDFVVRRERGVINRFLYSIAMIDNGWNGRAIYRFDGGVAIGHDQGTLGGSALDPYGLGKGYAILHSSGTRTSTHYNLILGGETALMVKERFIEQHGLPLYTVGVGASGGAIQQYAYAQNHGDRVIDAAIPQYSYPDMATQTIHVGDCELLERYMDHNPRWAKWDDRTALIGMNAGDTVTNPYTGAQGSDECVNGWRGLTPLAMNPLWTSNNDPEWQLMDPPGVKDTVQWTHWDDLYKVYGRDAAGYARSTWDNVGVQYGLKALTTGAITPEEFLDVNAKAGSWKEAADMVQEGCPYVPAACPSDVDLWSARNMNLGDPAPRRTGDPVAIRNVLRSGLVFRGDIDLPVIDWRHYLEDELDMHNAHQSFASRKRMLNHDGQAGNQVIWFTDARPDGPMFDQTPEALRVIDAWMANIQKYPSRGVVGNKPSDAVDRCFATDGTQIAAGPNVWDGVLDRRAPGACTQRFPLYSTTRIVAGGPIEGGVYKCRLQPVDRAVARGLYGTWRPDQNQLARLKQIFPTGVCDY
ncbi:hypothetical protein SAMN05444920_102758 [Nonomuraea solani]|uniref:DUF6351 domain-containing protein n=1 Tax=Nonomuraea solani TaxID=1144553 RepID=A0A1H5ZLH3_9ACTN|nr:DUF6351 family protein [Nonomuraea solani]SEG37279.1 hypothetical protein SAMN05444920_102758 [Nonomuraea solani]